MSPPNPNTKPILAAYADYTGSDAVYSVAKFKGAAKTLAGYGLQPDQLAPLLAWCREQWIGRNGVDMLTAQMMYWQWVSAGRPGALSDSLTVDEQIAALRVSDDPLYLGSAGARLRQEQIAALERTRPDGSTPTDHPGDA